VSLGFDTVTERQVDSQIVLSRIDIEKDTSLLYVENSKNLDEDIFVVWCRAEARVKNLTPKRI
jgi:hypothetical protein